MIGAKSQLIMARREIKNMILRKRITKIRATWPAGANITRALQLVLFLSFAALTLVSLHAYTISLRKSWKSKVRKQELPITHLA